MARMAWVVLVHKFDVGQNKLWIENFIDNTHATHATHAIYQTRLLQIKSQAVANNPLAQKLSIKYLKVFSKKVFLFLQK